MKDQQDIGLFDVDLAIGHVVFVVAKRPVDQLKIDFEGFTVNGVNVPLNRPGPLPADQGFWIDVGAFAVGTEIKVAWEIRSGIRVPDGEVLFGHCPNGRLTKLVRLERVILEPFKTYTGAFTVVPESI